VDEQKKDVPFDAPWAKNLAHQSDPNRVSSLHVPMPGEFMQRPPAAREIPADPATLHGVAMPKDPSTVDPQKPVSEPSYYDVPILKKPVWKWEIAGYFFLGGLSAGAYVLGRAAERAGGEKYRDLTRMAANVALGTLIPCPPLLIHDLGDPKRFHHMLRVWKPSTPMNFGTWSIVAYTGMAAYEVVRQYLSENERRLPQAHKSALAKLMNNGTLLLLHDAAGMTFSLLVAGYTGVLLSCTANPLWSKNPYLGPLFSASAIATGAEAVSLALDLFGSDDEDHSHSQEALRKIDTIAHIAEMALMQGMLKTAGEKARPLTHGGMKNYQGMSKGGIIAAEALKLLPVPRPMKRPMRLMWNLLGLAAGFSMRWGMVMAGHEAAADPLLSRLAGRAGGAVSSPRGEARSRPRVSSRSTQARP
jgi:formate-dependent nitrite reductase membrane component NrfD